MNSPQSISTKFSYVPLVDDLITLIEKVYNIFVFLVFAKRFAKP